MTKARTLKATTVPGLSSIPSNITPELRRYLENLAEAVEIRLGRRGDERDRAITLRELLDSGLAVELASNPIGVGPAPPPPPPPPPPSATPTAPTNFTANGGYSLITCFWDYPNYSYHSLTEIWRNSANVIGNAQLVGISSGISFVDPVGEGASFYYWARHVNEFGVAGPYNAINGTLAQTALDVVELLNVLTGAITESQLYQNLGARINLIDANASVTNSVAWRVAQEASARAQAISDEASARNTALANEASARAAAITNSINALTNAVAYNAGTTYKKGDLVTYNGSMYEAKSTTTGNLPTNTTYWLFLGTFTNLGDIVNKNGSKITEINTISASSGSAAAQAIAALESTVNNPTTGVVSTASAVSALTTEVFPNGSASASRIDNLETTVNNPTTGVAASASALSVLNTEVFPNGSASASRIDTLESTVNNPTTGLSATAAAVSTLNTEVFPNGSASASRIDTLESAVNNPTTGLSATASAVSTLNTEVFPNGSASASRIDTLETTVNNPTTGLSATATAVNALNTEVFPNGTASASRIDTLESAVNNPTTGLSATSSAVSALNTEVFPNGTASASRIDNLETSVNHPTTGLSATSGAVSILTSEVFPNGTAAASRIDSLESTVNNPTTGVSASALAISTLNTEVFPNGTASASSIDTLSTTVGNNTASIQTNTSSINGLQAKYTVKIDNNGHVSGFGLASETNNGTTSSAFIIRADKFAIVDPASTANNLTNTPSADTIPFVVVTTPQIINGVSVPPGVYMKDAYIQNGTITTAKIGLAQIDDARIASISAAKISTGSLDAARITVDNVTLDSYYDSSIGRNRLYIPDLGVKTAKIDNLAVSTLKIAGAAITVPQVYTSGEILVSSTIVMTGGGPSDTYNYVGTGNGDYVYVYDPWYGIQDYFFVGAGNGDYTRTQTNTTPTFTGATLVMETPQINIGVDTTAACQFVFYATMDAGHTLDCGQHLFMMMDKYDGNGYILIGEQRVGTRTYGGDTKAILPITMTYTGTSLQNVRIKVVSGTRLVDGNPGQGSNSSYLKNITLSVMGVKR